jgi:DNA (cytosine-5)-methyltransferase 1
MFTSIEPSATQRARKLMSTESPKVLKLERLQQGAAPRVVDLFAGCGGMSLGFKAAGFSLMAAVEFDEIAAQSHAKNFFGNLSEGVLKAHETALDITKTSPKRLAAIHEWANPKLAIDVLIGGPPCQSFARVGRAKLREIAEHPEAFMRDDRANLYLRYLEYVDALQPLVVVMENVPDIMNFGGQ